MRALFKLHDDIFDLLEDKLGPWLIPTLARFSFAAVLLFYFWNSAKTKIGEGIFGIFNPGIGAYASILPKQMEAVGFDESLIGFGGKLVVYLGTWAEFVLPALVILGLFSRLAAIGMIGFIIVQSVVDITGHGADASTIGALFDRASDSVILDQRTLWVFLLITIVVKGGGPFSVDRLLGRT